MKKLLIAVTLLLLLASASAFAQVTASLSGTVADASGALIPGVEVTSKNVNTGITNTTVTNETGSYVILALQPGTYTLTAALSGFKTTQLSGIVLGEGQAVRENFKLEVGAAAGTTVDVNVAADTVLATTSASVGNVLPERDVLTMPLMSRNILDLVSTTAGVVMTQNLFSASSATPSMVMNFGGTGPDAVNTTRDGLVTNDGRYNSENGAYSGIFTSPDMIEEVKVTANNIDPTLGRGSAQVQMRTRAGTNEFHGAGFYTNNNSALNAQQYFNNIINAPKNYLNRNQYGARLGGPIIKNKAFFFILTDNQRFLDKVTDNATVLTPLARQGIFRYMNNGQRNANFTAGATSSVDINGNPVNAAAVSQFNVFNVGDQYRTGIDQTWFGPQYLTRMPLPNNYTVGDGLNTAGFQWLRPENGLDGSTGSSPDTNRNQLTARVDYQLNDKNKISFSMSREKDWGVSQQTGEPDYSTGTFGSLQRLPYFYTGSFTSTISATMLNEFRIGKKRDSWIGSSGLDNGCCLNASENTRNASAQALYNSYPQVPGSFVYLANSMGLGNYVQFGVAAPRITSSPYTQIGDTLSWTKGAHSFSAGFDFAWAGSYGANSGNTDTTRPNATLGAGFNPSPIAVGKAYDAGISPFDVSTAQNLAYNLAGSISSIAAMVYLEKGTDTAFTDYTKDYLFYRYQHENDWDLFFKDNWKVRKDLTLILGMRYDKYGVPYDSFGLGGRYTSANGGGEAALFGCSGANFSSMWTPGAGNCDSASPTLTAGEFVGKDSPQPNKLIHPNDWKDFGPSIGFSYNLPGKELSNTVLRGGYGINYAAAPTFLAYSGNFGSLNGETQNVTLSNFTTPGGYLSAALLGSNPQLFPLKASITPFQAVGLNVPLLSRNQSITGYADNWRAPYVQSFNLAIQHQLTRSITFDIGWVGNKVSRAFMTHQLDDVNTTTNGFLQAFNNIRAGGEDPLMSRIFQGINFPGVGVVNGTTLTAGQALRKSASWNGNLANGQVGAMANQINTDSTSTPRPGGLLQNGGLNQNFFVTNPAFSSASVVDNSENSSYEAFQTHVTKRISQGLTGQFSYTFSKNLGDSGIRDWRNFSLDKGLVAVDRTHVITSNATYDLPFGQNRLLFSSAPGWADRIINGWQIASIATWTSGAPLSFTGNGGIYNTATQTVDQVGPMPKGQIFRGPGYVSYFNNLKTCGAIATATCSVTAPLPNFGGDPNLPGKYTNQVLEDANNNILMQNAGPGEIGHLSTNVPNLFGPGTLLFNMAATKTVRISEGKTFTLRADAVNVLNKPQWGAPNTSINSTTFGRITTSLGQRIVTLNARIDF